MANEDLISGGTATIAAGSKAVSGQGVSWTRVMPGDFFGAHVGLAIPIEAVSGGNITLAFPWPGASQAAAPYAIQQKGDVTRFQERIRLLVEGLTSIDAAVAAAVEEELADFVGSAPELLRSLADFAAAIGNDPNFAATIFAQLGVRLRFDADQGLSPAQMQRGRANLGLDKVSNLEPGEYPVSSLQASAIAAAVATEASARSAAIAQLVGSAPEFLDTFAEIAAAIGNNPNFLTTILTALGLRLRVDAPQILSAGQKLQGKANLDLDKVDNTPDPLKPISNTQAAVNTAVADSLQSQSGRLAVVQTSVVKVAGVAAPLTRQNILVAFLPGEEPSRSVLSLDRYGRYDNDPIQSSIAIIAGDTEPPKAALLDKYGRYDDGLVTAAVEPADAANVIGGVLDAAGAVVRGFDPATGTSVTEASTSDLYALAVRVDGLEAKDDLADPAGQSDLSGIVYVKPVSGKSTVHMLKGAAETQFPPGTPTYDAFDPVLRRGSYIAYRSDRDGIMREWRTDILPQRQEIKRTAGIMHCLGYGQSNSEPWGIRGSYYGHVTSSGPVADGRALMFNNGVFPTFTSLGSWTTEIKAGAIPAANMGYFISASVDVPVNALTGDAAKSYDVESPGLGFAERFCAANPNMSVLVSGHGVGGYSLAQIKKGTQPYANLLAGVAAGKANAERVGIPYIIGHVDFIHGESDFASTTYQAGIQQLLADLDSDASTLIGYPVTIPWFAVQVGNWTAAIGGGAGTSTARSPLAQLALHEANPGKFMLYVPGYNVYYGAGPDTDPSAGEDYQDIHIDAYAVRLRQEYLAKAKAKFDATGAFDPLRPTAVTWDGTYVWVDLTGRVGSLQWDIYNASTNINGVVDPGNYGFRFCDAAGAAASVTISAVSIVGNRVRITPSAAPTGLYLGYADIGAAGAVPGNKTGARGCLADSDTTPPSAAIQAFRADPARYWGGQDPANAAKALINPCVVFRKPIIV